MGGCNVISLTSALLVLSVASGFAVGQKKPKGELVVPAWKIQVVDEAGKPLRNVLVRQVWKHYDIRDSDHEADDRTDENGFVSFPERREAHVSKLTRTKNRLKNMREFGVHASYGVHADIIAWGAIIGCRRLEGTADYTPGRPLPTKLQTRVATLPGFKCTP